MSQSAALNPPSSATSLRAVEDMSRAEPNAAFYHRELNEFVRPYDAVRTARAPDDVIAAFIGSTYAATATTRRVEPCGARSAAVTPPPSFAGYVS
ncbi:MAG TPA: DUF5996 family protein [Gammaproteobacteria bacterium]|nr:DUF5996 family protein [Gammaproteobacteria bacterium]